MMTNFFPWHRRPQTTAWAHASARRRAAVKQGAATEGYWLQRRDPERPQDMKLSALGKHWVESFPLARRPNSLCRKYPRLANRLALCWPDPQLTGMVLVDLLIDRRGGRRGFPADVQLELRQLLRGVLDEMAAMGLDGPPQDARGLCGADEASDASRAQADHLGEVH